MSLICGSLKLIVWKKGLCFLSSCRIISWKTPTVAARLRARRHYSVVSKHHQRLPRVTLSSPIRLPWLEPADRRPFGEPWHLLGWHVSRRRCWAKGRKVEWRLIDRGPPGAGPRKIPAEGLHTNKRRATSMLPKGFAHVNLGQINWLAQHRREDSGADFFCRFTWLTGTLVKGDRCGFWSTACPHMRLSWLSGQVIDPL